MAPLDSSILGLPTFAFHFLHWNATLKYELERYEKAELANGATRKFVNDNTFVIYYMGKYLKDIGAI